MGATTLAYGWSGFDSGAGDSELRADGIRDRLFPVRFEARRGVHEGGSE